jgi:hypothetical protein
MATITNTIRWASNSAELAANLKMGLDQIEATKAAAEKMVQTLSGDRLIAAAHKTVAALTEIGGASKLTAAEAERNFSLIDRAIQKLELTSRTVPTAMLQMRDALKDVVRAQEDASRATGGWLPLLHNLGTSWVARIAEGVLLRDAIRDVIGQVKELAMALPEIALKGAAVADVEDNFKRLTTQTGLLSDALMGELRAGTHNTITDFELMKSVNQDLAAGLHLTQAQFGILTKGAFALAQATGGDVKQAFDRMNDALLTGRVRSLAELTGKIQTTEAEEKFAAALHRSADQLTEEGKLEAQRAAILDAVGAATERLGEQTDGLDERVAQASVAWENFKENLGKTIATSAVLETGLSGLKTALEEALGGSQETAIKAIASAVDDLLIEIVELGKSGMEVAGFLVKEWYAAEKVFGDVAQVVDGVRLALLLARQAASIGILPGTTDLVMWKALDEQIATLEVTMKARGEALRADGQAQDAVDAKTAQYVATLETLRAKMAEAKAGAAATTHSVGGLTTATGAATVAATKHSEALFKVSAAETAAAKKFAESTEHVRIATAGYAGVLATLDGGLLDNIRTELTHGAKVEEVATEYGVARAAVEEITKQLKLEADVRKILTKETDQHAEVLERSNEVLYQQDELLRHGLNPNLTLASYAFTSAGFTVDNFGTTIDLANARGKELLTTLRNAGPITTAFAGILKSIPTLMQQSFTGGGGFSGAAQAIGSKAGSDLVGGLFKTADPKAGIAGGIIGESLAKMLPAKLLKMIPVFGEALGALVGPALTTLKKLFGGASQLELDGRKVEASFQAQFGSFQKMLNAVGDVYTATGRTYEQAQADVQALMAAEAKGPEAVKAALDTINSAFDEQKQDAADLQTAIAKYGFSLEQLGPALQKQQSADQAKEILNSWRLLVGSGIDLVAVDQQMASTTWDYLQLAKRTGQEVPAAMKPILQSMLDQGVFTDENGDKLTDLGQLGLTFSETMTEGFDKVVAKLQQLLEGLGLVPRAIEAIPSTKDIDITTHYTYDDPGAPEGADQSLAFSQGGLVPQYLARGGRPRWQPRGTDTVPAMLTPGELVLTKAQQAQLFSLPSSLLSPVGSAPAAASMLSTQPTPTSVVVSIPVTFQIEAIDTQGVRDFVDGAAFQSAMQEQLRAGALRLGIESLARKAVA